MRNFRLTVTACALGMVIACSGSSAEGELLVSAAASLTDAFAEMESAFEDANPDVDVLLNFGSSSALREQILEGAPADVFASANSSNMDQVAEAGELAGAAEIFVTNSLQIAVPTGNPAGGDWPGRLRQGGFVDRALRRGRPMWGFRSAGARERRGDPIHRHQ